MGSFVRVEDAPAKQAADPVAELATVKENLASKNKVIKALEEKANETEKLMVKLDENGLQFATKDGNFSSELHGRIQTDSQVNDQSLVNNFIGGNPIPPATGTVPATLDDGVGFRRVRLSINGALYKTTE